MKSVWFSTIQCFFFFNAADFLIRKAKDFFLVGNQQCCGESLLYWCFTGSLSSINASKNNCYRNNFHPGKQPKIANSVPKSYQTDQSLAEYQTGKNKSLKVDNKYVSYLFIFHYDLCFNSATISRSSCFHRKEVEGD